MAKLTKSQKARSQKVRLDKVSRDENRSQKRLLMAGALNNAAGIAIAAVASPVAGAVFTAAGNAVLAKQSLTVRGKAKSESARIKRGSQPSKTMEVASAAYRGPAKSAPQGGRLTAEQASTFQQHLAASKHRLTPKHAPASNPSDGMTDTHQRINKRTGTVATVKSFKTPTRSR